MIFSTAAFSAVAFLVAAFLAAGFFAVVVSAAAAFLAAAFLATVFLAAGFPVAAFVATTASVAAFFTALFAALFFAAGAFPACPSLSTGSAAPASAASSSSGLRATAFLAADFPAAAFFGAPAVADRTDFTALESLAAPPEAPEALVELPDADCCTAVFFATMAAAPSHIVILHANRAGTINRLGARGNGRTARFARLAASLHPLCPAPRPVIRRAGHPGIRTHTPSHIATIRVIPDRVAVRVPRPRKPVGRCRRGAVHWAERKVWMGTSSGVRSPERPGDGGSPGASAT